ncbi:MAG TPA: hypothetical protein VMN79_13060 [Casimicrobiaceae bacterium]|nr:hypothetical protein [Casimicrobiaceae bacterium]
MRPAPSFLIGLVCLVSASVFAQAPLPAQRIRGDIVAINGLDLQVKSRTGEMLAIKLADNYTVTAVVKTDLDAVKPGSFVGAASMPQPDGTQKALEVLLFPEAMRGAGEGHYPWDLKPGSMMTNATVTDAVVEGVAGRRMTLKYKDGEKTLIVPPDAPIVTFEPGDRTMAVPGAHLLVTAAKQPDGTFTAGRLAIGKAGLVPPM